MELFTKDEPGQAIFFSPGKIAAAKARQQELETQKEADTLVKQTEKHRRATEKEQKAQEVRDRKIARQELAAQKREAKIQEKEARKLQKQEIQQLRSGLLMPTMPAKSTTRPKKRKAVEDPPPILPAPKSRLGRNGRKIALPGRFHD